MINLDPTLVNQDDIRKKKRKKLLALAVAPFSLIMIISLFFLSTSFYNILCSFLSNGGDYTSINTITETRYLLNIVEPYIAPYNQGVANIKVKEYKIAEENFKSSLRENPPQEKLCMIYVNLSLSIELQGDQLLIADNFEGAIEKYNLAESTLYNNGCSSRNGRGKDEKADKARDRIDIKRKDAANKMNGENGNSDPDSGNGESGEISQEELNRILENGGVAGNEFRGVTSSNQNGNFGSGGCDTKKGDVCW